MKNNYELEINISNKNKSKPINYSITMIIFKTIWIKEQKKKKEDKK